MPGCGNCGAETDLFINQVPICLDCVLGNVPDTCNVPDTDSHHSIEESSDHENIFLCPVSSRVRAIRRRSYPVRGPGVLLRHQSDSSCRRPASAVRVATVCESGSGWRIDNTAFLNESACS